MDDAMPAMGRLTPEWVDFFMMAGVLVLVAFGLLIWGVYIRKRGGKHRHKRARHHERHSTNPTLAQKGGLPPVRPLEQSDDSPPPKP